MRQLYCATCGRPLIEASDDGRDPPRCCDACRSQIRNRQRLWAELRDFAVHKRPASQIAQRVPDRIIKDING